MWLMGHNLTPKATIPILIPVMSSLGLRCKSLINFFLVAATFTNNIGLPVAIQDNEELGVEPPLCLLELEVINHCHQTILLVQLPALLPGTGGTKATAALCTAA